MQKNIITFLCLLVTISLKGIAQQHRNLPIINVSKVPTSAYEVGQISFKFKPSNFVKYSFKKNNNGNIVFGIPVLDNILKSIETKKCIRIFEKAILNVEFETQHANHQLDKWFTIFYNASIATPDLINYFKTTNLFEVVEPVYKKALLENKSLNSINFSTNDPQFNKQWSLENNGQADGTVGKDIKIKEAWDIETGKPNVIVALLDQGVQLNHPDLQQNMAVSKSFNFIDNTSTLVPGHHGTHTGGTIAAVNNNNLGISSIAGGNGSSNSGIRLMSMQVYGTSTSAGHAEAFIYAADNGACITNNSWAYIEPDVYELSIMDAIDYFIQYGGGSALQGGLVVFAAGNTSRPARLFPSAYDRVICVAASNNKDEKSNYSTFGSWVDITAPGGAYGGESSILSTTINNGYRYDHGTSMACPHVVGVAALIASKLSGKASANDVREILLSTTDDIYNINPAFVGQLGSGRLNALKALQKAEQINNNYSLTPINKVTGTFNCNNLQLSWIKNVDNNNVIILYSNTSNLPLLQNGVAYNVGDKIKDAIVVYKGSAANLTYPNNNDLLHYFKLFSYNNSNQYSLSKTFEFVATTLIDSSGIQQQNFNFAPYFPTQEWRTLDPDSDFSWMHSASDTSSTGFNDDYSMCMYNYKDNQFVGRVDWLRSPYFNIKNADSLSVSFYHSYKNRVTGLPVSDTLEVLVSNDCGISWNTLFKKGGRQLATIPNETDSFFRPFGKDKWQLNTYDLTSFKNAEKLQLSFKAVNGKGNNVYVDNIKLNIRYKTDVSPFSIEQPFVENCTNAIVPQVKIANNGNSIINTLKITALVDNLNPIVTNFSGNILKDGIAFIALNTINNITPGIHQLKIITSLPNNALDNYVQNDTLTCSFIIENASASFPLFQNFEQTSIETNGWAIQQLPEDSLSWSITNMAASMGAKSAIINNFFYNYTDNRKDDILSPIVDVKEEVDSAFLLYSYAHATKHNVADNVPFDTLEISVSNDCGNTWQTIIKKWGVNLQTTTQTTGLNTYFNPSFLEWKRDSINITGKFNIKDKVRFRFRNTQNFGNNLYIDDIKVYTKKLPQQLKDKGYVIHPNPTKDNIYISFLQFPTTLKNVRIINALGKTVLVYNETLAQYQLKLNLLQLAAGLYTVQFVYKDKVVTQKIVKY